MSDETRADRPTASMGSGATADTGNVAPARVVVGEKPGDTIGPYKLLEVLGEGGFGVVWLGERREPIVQRVAIKVIKPGMDTRAVVARFEQERQALAVMDHPNIAKVLDAGATGQGRPYFVMEYVRGEPITSYCDRRRLGVRPRLELFLTVCDAVQHAHAKGIIHRDLKPSNVLVSAVETGEGVSDPVRNALVKVIDFGIAKALVQTLTEKTLFTEQGQILGTPEYMSPEQAGSGMANDIDTRTDVYSMGVMLYELLTGMLPFDPRELRSRGFEEIRRVIREVDPPNPSTRLSTLASTRTGDATELAVSRSTRVEDLRKLLKSELEWIPLKAMRKERELRYQSPRELGLDIRNYLENRALIAGPESGMYRARKFVRKHRVGVSVAAGMGAMLAAATVVSVAFGVSEARARHRAEVERRTAEAVNRFLNEDLLQSADPELGGIQMAVVDLLGPAAERVDETLKDQPEVRARVKRTLGESYLALGEPATALKLLEDSLKEGADSAFEAEVSAKIAEARFRNAGGQETVRFVRGQMEEAEKKFGPRDERTMNLRNQLGGALKAEGEYDEAEKEYRRVLADRLAVKGEKNVDVLITRHNLNLIGLRRARMMRGAGDKEGAQKLFEETLAERRAITADTRAALGADHPQTLATWSEEVALTAEAGKPEEAIVQYPAVIEALRGRLGVGHWRTLEVTARYGAALNRAGKNAEAIDQLTIALEGYRFVRGPTFGDTLAITDVLVSCLKKDGRKEKAEWLLVRAAEDAKGDAELEKLRRGKLEELRGG